MKFAIIIKVLLGLCIVLLIALLWTLHSAATICDDILDHLGRR